MTRAPWSRETYRVAAWINSVLAVITLVIAWQIPFPEKTDFDITGLLYVLTALPALLAWAAFAAFAIAAAGCWAKSS